MTRPANQRPSVPALVTPPANEKTRVPALVTRPTNKKTRVPAPLTQLTNESRAGHQTHTVEKTEVLGNVGQ